MSITQRIDRVTLIDDVRRSVTPPAPISVKIELTGRCNYRCGFCALRTRKVQPKGDMDFALFKKMTREMKEAGVEEIGLFYLGESTMAPGLLVEALRWVKRDLKFDYAFLTTNGSLLNRILLQELFKNGLDSLKFSINAADETQFEEVMGVKAGLYADALRNLRLARELRDQMKSNCKIYASSIRYDGVQQARMSELLEKGVLPFVDEHYELPLYSMGSLATQREEELGYRPTAGNQGRIGALREPLPCWSLWEGHVTADGSLSACCFDADNRWRMGDLTKQTFMEAWHSTEFRNLRAAHLKKDVTGTPCAECVAYR